MCGSVYVPLPNPPFSNEDINFILTIFKIHLQ
jgi:hypothetical protein